MEIRNNSRNANLSIYCGPAVIQSIKLPPFKKVRLSKRKSAGYHGDRQKLVVTGLATVLDLLGRYAHLP